MEEIARTSTTKPQTEPGPAAPTDTPTDDPSTAADATTGADDTTAADDTDGVAGVAGVAGVTMPPPPVFNPQAVRRLYRGKGPISGVAAGLAEYFNVDPSLVRVGLAAGTLLGGPIVPIGYIAAWVIIPEADPAPVPPITAPPVDDISPVTSPAGGPQRPE